MFSKLFKIIYTILKNPKSLLRVLNPPEGDAKTIVCKKHNLPFGLPIVKFNDVVFNENIKSVFPYTYLEGGSLPTDYLLLKQLASNPDCNIYFEIGTWRGESIANVAPLVQQAFSLNLSTDELTQRGEPDTYINQVGMFAKNIPNVTLLKGDSTRFDYSDWYGKCDLVFIDGDHNYSSLIKDTQNAFKLLKPNTGVIVWHDYGFSPEVIRWEVLLAILDAVPVALHHQLYHIRNTKCALFSAKTYQAEFIKRPMIPNQVFEVSLNAKDI